MAVTISPDTQISAADRRWVLVLQLCILVAAAAVAFKLAEIWLYAALMLYTLHFDRPAVFAGIILLICLLLFLCVRGAAMSAVKPIQYVCRAILLAFAVGAGVVSLEFLYGGLVASGLAGLGGSLEDHVPLLAGIALVASAAAGIKYAFGWRLHYLIVLIITFTVVLASTAYIAGGIFFA